MDVGQQAARWRTMERELGAPGTETVVVARRGGRETRWEVGGGRRDLMCAGPGHRPHRPHLTAQPADEYLHTWYIHGPTMRCG